jgi:hypothetical protein
MESARPAISGDWPGRAGYQQAEGVRRRCSNEEIDLELFGLILRSIAERCVSKDRAALVLRDARFAGSSG